MMNRIYLVETSKKSIHPYLWIKFSLSLLKKATNKFIIPCFFPLDKRNFISQLIAPVLFRVALIIILSFSFYSLVFGTVSKIKKKPSEVKVLIWKGEEKNFTIKNLFTEKELIHSDSEMRKNEKRYFFDKLSLGRYQYRGMFILKKKAEKIYLINQIPLEEYLAGVLESEISWSWPIESIKAQAVAARSYAISHIRKNKKQPWDLVSDERHQVFRGSYSNHPKLAQAVKKTKNMVIQSRGKIVQTFFTASCGGITEKAHNVWPVSEDLSYFQHVRCHYCTTHPKYQWSYRISKEKLAKNLSKEYPIKDIKNVKVHKKNSGKRIEEIKINQSSGSINIPAAKFRLLVNPQKLQSTIFTITGEKNAILFSGRGYGHGVGLCQWGAKTMAENSYDFRSILQFYYKNIQLRYLRN